MESQIKGVFGGVDVPLVSFGANKCVGALERQNFFVVSLSLALIAMVMARIESISSFGNTDVHKL
jgi:hypothetical protein